ncbi:excinuclease ABC subunit C [Candidatus Saccharibacteria bacterium 32-49-12]|nr:MAG: excinuclease ABC subunit C [Candidatus Saccharibacteria bacterium 32-49-12]
MSELIDRKLKDLPRSPGVYFHKDKSGQIIYVGKAAVLRHRVRQYFQKSRDMDIKTRALVDEIADVDWVETESELDALFLESEMVKRYMPRFNILLRDDKSQTYIRIDLKSQWPTVTFTRNPLDDGASYFGPYYSALAIKKGLRYLRRIFPYYTKPRRDGQRPDLDAHIGLSPDPDTTSAQYKTNLKQLIRYIKGDGKGIVRELESQMKQAARAQDFETAAQIRNKLLWLKSLSQKIMFGDREFLDISKDKALTDLKYLLSLEQIPKRIEGFDISHMSGTNVVASMVVFSNGVSDRTEYRKFKTRQDRNDDYANMYEVVHRRLSPKNIQAWGKPDLIIVDGGKGQLEAALKASEEQNCQLAIISIAKRDEEIIIHPQRSNVSVGHLFDESTVSGSDLFISRSGGYIILNLHPGQMNASSHSKNLRGGGFSKYDHVTKLIQRIRDESHRFAVSYHTVLKRANQSKSQLDDIAGIGPATRRQLIKKFGSVRALKAASLTEITEVVGRHRAQLIVNGLVDR